MRLFRRRKASAETAAADRDVKTANVVETNLEEIPVSATHIPTAPVPTTRAPEAEPIEFPGVAEVLGEPDEFSAVHDDLDAVEDRLDELRERHFALREPIWAASPPVAVAPAVVDVSDGATVAPVPAKHEGIDLSVHADFTTFNDDFDRRIDELLELTGPNAAESSLEPQ